MAPPAVDLGSLQTENRNSRTVNIDNVSTDELCRMLHAEDCTVPSAVQPCLSVISQAIDALTERVRRGGRVFYIGAGTSGRLGVLDASEIPPTYSAPPGQFVGLIAGGDYALRNAKEGAEDDAAAAQADLDAHSINGELDALIGIASSGRTPYVQGGLKYAKSLGCPTVGVVCVSPSAIGKDGHTDYLIAAVTGPESVTGSTRMKAGTATKLVLNMLSTGVMIKMGKTYGNLMIDLKATNLKLQQRSRMILRAVAGEACTQSNDELDQILEACHGSTKIAAVTIVLNCSVEEAEERLQRNSGVLAKVFAEAKKHTASSTQGLVLCVDAGGSACKAVIAGPNGVVATGSSGPSNVTSIGVDAGVSAVAAAVQQALDSCDATRGSQLQSTAFAKVWVAMAGYDRPSVSQQVDARLATLFNLEVGKGLRITTDIDLLPTTVTSSEVDNVIVLVAGTGSVAMSYAKQGSGWTRTNRVGGWGHLLGDDGSGYHIGREALRLALREVDVYRITKAAGNKPLPLSPLTQAVIKHHQHLSASAGTEPEDLLTNVVAPAAVQNDEPGKAARIAGTARAVLDLAPGDDAAKRLVDSAAQSLAELVTLLMVGQGFEASSTGLVLSGGLMQHESYKRSVLDLIEQKSGQLKSVASVTNAALEGAKWLQQN